MSKDHTSSMHKQVKQRYGSSLEHGAAHRQQHRSSRRDFMKNLGLVAFGAPLMLGTTPVAAFNAAPLMAGLNASDCDRILVLIRLKGGNDGLNTVIHRGNDEYYNIRPNLAIQENNLWALNDDFGMHSATQDLQSFWQEGRMKIIHNIGYPDPNYSHFRSSDIWASASDANTEDSTGWIGRLMEVNFPAFIDAPPVVPPALQIGVQTNQVFRGYTNNTALSISNPTEFYQIAQSGQLYDTTGLGDCASGQELSYVRQAANSAFRYSESIRDAYNSGANQNDYPDNSLADQLAIVARLIKGNLGTKVYMVSIGGFDTHANQADDHERLLRELGSSVKAFFDDLANGDFDQNVMGMTFSEFGRTIFENGSQGTDHGTGGPMFLFGPETLGNGFVGTEPDLINIGPFGDPAFSVDFRSVYSTMLQDWLCVDPTVSDYVLGQTMDTIPDLVPLGNPSIGTNDTAALLGHNPDPNTMGSILIKYAVKRRGTTRLRILTISGQPIRTLFTAFREPNSYTFAFRPADYFLPPGEYLYQLDTGGKIYSRRLVF